MLTSMHLFDQKHNKNSTIVKLLQFKITVSYFEMLFIPKMA